MTWKNFSKIGSYFGTRVCVCAKSLQSCLSLCNPTDCNPPDSSVRGILQARLLDWVTMPASRKYFWPRDRTHVFYVSCISRQVFYNYPHLEAHFRPNKPEKLSHCKTLEISAKIIWSWFQNADKIGKEVSKNQKQSSSKRGDYKSLHGSYSCLVNV